MVLGISCPIDDSLQGIYPYRVRCVLSKSNKAILSSINNKVRIILFKINTTKPSSTDYEIPNVRLRLRLIPAARLRSLGFRQAQDDRWTDVRSSFDTRMVRTHGQYDASLERSGHTDRCSLEFDTRMVGHKDSTV